MTAQNPTSPQPAPPSPSSPAIQRLASATATTNRQQLASTRRAAQANKMPWLIIGGIVAVALIVCGVIFLPELIKQSKGYQVVHAVCRSGAKIAIEFPPEWGTSQFTNQELSIYGDYPKFPLAEESSTTGIFGASPDQHQANDDIVSRLLPTAQYNQLSGVGYDWVKTERQSAGSITTDSGLSLHWEIYAMTPRNLAQGASAIKEKVFFGSNGAYLATMIFSSFTEDFAHDEPIIDDVAKSFRFE
jgi:hypothetical protein